MNPEGRRRNTLWTSIISNSDGRPERSAQSSQVEKILLFAFGCVHSRGKCVDFDACAGISCLGLRNLELRRRKRVRWRVIRFSCMRLSISSGFRFLSNSVVDLLGLPPSSSSPSYMYLRHFRLICSQGLSSIAGDFSHLLAYNIMASTGAGICETVAVIVVDE